jgi:hypothetical protein
MVKIVMLAVGIVVHMCGYAPGRGVFTTLNNSVLGSPLFFTTGSFSAY